jgi:hypothetical protein
MYLNDNNTDLLSQVIKQEEVHCELICNSDHTDDLPTTDDLDIFAVPDQTTDTQPEKHIAPTGTQSLSKPPANKTTSEDSLYPPETVTALYQMSKEYAAVLLGGKFRIVKECFDSINKQHSPIFSTKFDFCAFLSNRRVPVSSKKDSEKKELARIWLDWKGRPTYEGVAFDPGGKQGPKVYNLFRGFPLEPKEGDWSLMRNHILDIICKGNPEHFDYLMGWMARILQDPGGKRPGVAVVLKAGKGIGKGAYVDYFGSIFGEAFKPIADSDSFTGRFNMHLSKALVVFLDEAFCNGDKKAEGKMKQLITEKDFLFEQKGIDAITLPNYINVIIASNEDWVVPASSDERRFFVLEPSEARQGDFEYFGRIAEERKNGGPEAMMYDLLHHDYSKINLRKAPVTEALSRQIQQSFSPVEDFWHSVLDRGYMLSEKETRKPRRSELADTKNYSWPDEVFKHEVYNEFVQWCQQQGKKKILSSVHFWRKTWEIWAGGLPRRYKKPDGDGKSIDALTLPTLAEARNAFVLKTKIKFDDQEEETKELLSE